MNKLLFTLMITFVVVGNCGCSLSSFRGRYIALKPNANDVNIAYSEGEHTELRIGWLSMVKTSTDEGGCSHVQEWSKITRSGNLIFIGKLEVTDSEHYSTKEKKCISSKNLNGGGFDDGKLPIELILQSDTLNLKMITSETDSRLNLHEKYAKVACPFYDLECWL